MIDQIFTNLPTLQTDRLILRKLEYSDQKDIFEYAQNPSVSKYLVWYPHKTEIDSLSFLNLVYDCYNHNKPAPWGISLKERNKIIGTAGFISLDKVNHKAELGFALSEDYWNRGLISEACKIIIKFGFQDLKLNRIEARCMVENLASAKVLEKLGFIFEGIMRKQIFIKEEYWDMKIYSLLRDDCN